MNGANGITIDTSTPANTESAGLGAQRMISIETTFQSLLNDEHNVPTGSANNVGYHLMGSARPYYGTQSRVSSSGTDARLMLTSDTSRLFGVGSGGTVLLGAGPTALSLGSTYGQMTFPQRTQYVMECGTGLTASSGTTTVTFPNSGYSGVPYMQLTAGPGGVADTCILVISVNKTTCVVESARAATGSGISGQPFFWTSLGTRAL